MDLYELLEINENNFDINSLKKNYHKMCLKHHPDKGGCEYKFKLIQGCSTGSGCIYPADFRGIAEIELLHKNNQ